MIELLMALVILSLACLGLAVGVLRGRPLRTSCEASACLNGGRCALCPRRKEAENG